MPLSFFVLEEFAKQFTDALFGCLHGLAANWCGGIDAANFAIHPVLARLKQTLTFEAVHDRIERAGTQAVPMTRELLNHSQAKNGLLAGMVKNMQSDQTGIEGLVGGGF